MEELISNHSVYVDTQIYPVGPSGHLKLPFIQKHVLKNIFVRQLIVRRDDAPLDGRYMVARFSGVKRFNNSLLYNTSLIDPDTDIILDKAHSFGSYDTYEGRYVLPIQAADRVFDSLSVQILDDSGRPLGGHFFVDIKLSTGALK